MDNRLGNVSKTNVFVTKHGYVREISVVFVFLKLLFVPYLRVSSSLTPRTSQYGSHCEFDEPCPFLALDQRKEDSRYLRDTWKLLVNDTNSKEHILANDRPVYTYELDEGYVNAIVFRGRRWILVTFSPSLFEIFLDNAVGNKNRGNGWQVDATSWLQAINNSEQIATSDPVDHQTETYSYTPIGLKWYAIKENNFLGSLNMEPDKNQLYDVPLLCANCTFLSNTCVNDGICFDDNNDNVTMEGQWGYCACPVGYRGYLCEYEENCIDDNDGTCFNNGTCITEGYFAGYCDCPENASGHLCQHLSSNVTG